MRKAFTLIELLVVVGIVAILAAILFPVFARAKESAKTTTSISYLKQNSLAWVMYSADYDTTIMRDSVPDGSATVYWWGRFDGVTLEPTRGLMHPYMRSTGVQSDPLWNITKRTALGETGYAYNYAYLSPSVYSPPTWEATPVSVSESAVEAPSETIAFVTGARVNDWSGPAVLEASAYLDPPSYDYPGVHGRAFGMAVVVWCDTHVTRNRPSFRSGTFGYGHDSSHFTKENLGDLIKPGCEPGTACQDFYYETVKTK